MNVKIDGCRCIVTREPGDPSFRGIRNDKGESRLLHHVKLALIGQGHDLIKKRMWKDGHLVDDRQQYLRTRKSTGDSSRDIYIYNDHYAIWSAGERIMNDGTVTLAVITGVFDA
jgi:hypothetical protein